MSKRFALLLFCCFCCRCVFSQAEKTPTPSKQQLAWQDMEFYLFVHFGPNTFTDREWGAGTEPEDVFNPDMLDCRQWCRIAKAAGAAGIIITAKHHDGFCLWPSKYSTHTVRESKWRNGHGDVLKELSIACREAGLKFGVYLSPWDRNHPKYGTQAYNDVFINMMKEIFANYGPVWELWWDGANGEGPNGKKQVYDWRRFESTVRRISPSTVIFSDIGPDIRWCGNEDGYAGRTNWNYLDTAGFARGIGAPPTDTLNNGNINGLQWIPAECDVSIRPGWFYHPEQDAQVKTPAKLFELYLRSVGRGANLLLNVPPDRDGLLGKNDSAALIEFRHLRDRAFAQDILQAAEASVFSGREWQQGRAMTDDDRRTSVAVRNTAHEFARLKLSAPRMMNCVVLEEDLRTGQHCKSFTVSLFDKDNRLVKELTGTTIGHQRILVFPGLVVNSLRLSVTGQKSPTLIAGIKAYLLNETITANDL
jgi:alpha-L-fucosidase